jgi:hypothetical protein
MKAAAHSRRPPIATTGFLAALGRLLALLVLAGALLAIVVSSAGAFSTHAYIPSLSEKLSEGIPAEGPHGEAIPLPGQLNLEAASMTVDSGHLWIADNGDRVDEFDAATGAFMSQLAQAEGQATFGICCGRGRSGIAVGHSTGELIYVGERIKQSADIAIFDNKGTLETTWTGAATPAGSFANLAGERTIDVAVDNSTDPLDEAKGDVYVVDGEQQVIDVFHPEADGKEHYVGQITGPGSGKLFSPTEIPTRVAVDSSNGDVVVMTGRESGATSTVDIFEPGVLGQYTLAHKITGPINHPFNEIYDIAVDSGNGEIYVREKFENSNGKIAVVLSEFSVAGAYLGTLVGADTPTGELINPYALTVDPETHYVYFADREPTMDKEPTMYVFGPDIVTPDVTTAAPSGVTPSGATLEGTVNPLDAGAATCRFEWGTGRAFGKTAPCEPEGVTEGDVPVSVHAALSGLQTDTTYFYRLEAKNANGANPGEASQDQEFTTSGPGILEASVTNLADTSVTFDASINPHKVQSSYYYQYGTSASYGSDFPAAPGEAIGAGEGAVDVTPHHVQGLAAGTVYHYRVVVVTEPQPGETVVFYGPDQTFTTEAEAVSGLPDGRQWEMVSPPDKHGATIYPILEAGVVQAADSGDAIAYLADNPTESESPGFSNRIEILSTRGADGWETKSISPPHSGATGPSVGEGSEYRFFSPDLSEAVVQPFGSFLPELSPEASEATAMLRSLSPSCASSCYHPLVTGKPGFANVPPGTVFGEEPEGFCEGLYCGPQLIGATPDLRHMILDDVGNLGDVEWSEGKLTPIDEGAHGGLTFAGGSNSRGAISSDGSRVILDAGENFSPLYMRDLALEKTVPLNVAEPACVAENKCESETAGGLFELASTDGSKVFFTNGPTEPRGSQHHRLTKDASEDSRDLYECEMVEAAGELHCKLSDIAKEAIGVLGASEDASYLYFVANSVLAEGAVPGECDEIGGSTPPPGTTCNLYVRHDGVTKFVALLSGEDYHDWATTLSGSPVSVSPNGNWLEFMSQRSVTGYDNRDAVSGKTDAEVYLYDASTGRVVCASCDPSGARPTGANIDTLASAKGGLTGGTGLWYSEDWVAATVPGWIQFRNRSTAGHPRYLSDSGRLFFNSGDALVPQDVNGTQDVYEYEPPGVGDCTTVSTTFSERSGGCVALISSGTSAEESGFLDASEDGGDVFFLTYAKLQPQDYDNDIDIYDAHECTSAAPCFPTPIPQPPACTTAEACRAAPTPQPTSFGAPASATFSGVGDVVSSSGSAIKPKPLTRAQKLANALKTCRRKPKRKRATCERRARAQYGPVTPHKAASKKKGKR